MAFDLCFQGPDEGGTILLELLADAARSSDGGIAVFSFASVGGVRLLFGDPDFGDFLLRGEFRLIVGVDAVTTPDVLTMLADETQSRPGLRTNVFLHHRKAALFHPKVSWFYSTKASRAIVGSGNLTRGGLLNNWEAFIDAKARSKGTKRISSTWDRWLRTYEHNLRLPNDAEAISRAENNKGMRERHEEDAVEVEDDRIEANTDESVLLAEIPRAADRWNQANFDKSTYIDFFGLMPGSARRVVLFPVRPDGTVDDPEVRPGVDVKSRNYRVELGQAVGIQYPSSGRPVGVFRRTGVRRFRYRLFLPGDDGFDSLQSVLARQDADHAHQVRMRRVVLPYVEFLQLTGGTLTI